jgi:hypothetical protein
MSVDETTMMMEEVPLKRQDISTRIDDVTFQTAVIFTVTFVRS